MNNTTIIKRIDSMEAIADMLKEEAAKLRIELGFVQTPTPQKGSFEKKAAQIVAKRNMQIFKQKIRT